MLGIYLGGAWVALQGIEALVSVLGLPDWVPGFALVRCTDQSPDAAAGKEPHRILAKAGRNSSALQISIGGDALGLQQTGNASYVFRIDEGYRPRASPPLPITAYHSWPTACSSPVLIDTRNDCEYHQDSVTVDPTHRPPP